MCSVRRHLTIGNPLFATGSLDMQAIRVSILLAVISVSAVAYAAPVVWTLENVTLTDGQSLAGSFTYDDSTAIFSDIAIVNSGTEAHPSALWNTEFLFSPPRPGVPAIVVWLMAGPGNQTNETLMIIWNQFGQQQRLTDAGGVVALRPAGPPNGPNFGVFETCGEFLNPTAEFPTFVELPTCENATVLQGQGGPYVVGGTLAAVPIPATAWLLATAWSSLGLFRGRTRIR